MTYPVPDTLADFIARERITMTAELKPARTDGNLSDMPEGSFHWLCTFQRDHGDGSAIQMAGIWYSAGPAHATKQLGRKIPTPPTAKDVLGCLISDAQCWHTASSFEDFAGDLGYDADSRKAERIYHACGQTWKDLRRFLGADAFRHALEDVDAD